MKNIKRIAALTVVILWGILLIATFISACIGTPFSQQLFKGLLYTDFVLPVVAYAMLLVYKYLIKRNQ